MYFAINLFNHVPIGRQSLEDLSLQIGAQLKTLGHQVMVDNQRMFQPPVHNVLFECFDEGSRDILCSTAEAGTKFVIITTERHGPYGFLGYDADHNQGKRQHIFPEVAAKAEAIWCLIPEETQWYRQFNPNTHTIELGYSPVLQKELPTEDPEFDFCFFGLINDYRRSILLDLRKQFKVLVPSRAAYAANYLPMAVRDEMVQKAKVSLHLKHSPEWNTISASRCVTSLHLGRPVYSEAIDCESPFQGIIDFPTEPDRFIDDAGRFLSMWRDEAREQVILFKTLTADRCIGTAVKALRD